MKKAYFYIVLSLFMASNLYAQSFDATVNRNSLPEGETLVLTLNLQDVDTSSTPDLSALSQDFTVLSVSNSYRTNITNGQVKKSRQWNLVMIPNSSGDKTIPEIELAGYKTKPVTIKVIPAGSEDKLVTAQQSDAAPKFKMTGKINNSSPYVQQQINYQLKIYDAGGLQGASPYFVTQNDDWVIRNLGEPIIETKIVNGQSLREITFNYALFPQKSGQLTIPAVKFDGYYLTKNTRNDPFARFFEEDEFFAGFGLNTVFANKNPFMLTAKPINVDVKPAKSTSGWWLPAQDIKLSAEFDGNKHQFKVGEPISRTIYLKAVGVLESNLPEIKFASVNGIKQYPEKPVNEMTVQNSQIVSFSKISNVYIPEYSGETVLPAIEVKWFNTKTDSFETAIIPEHKINVTGNAVTKSIEPQPQVTVEKNISSLPERITDNNIKLQQANTKGFAIWQLIVAFVGGILITLLLLRLLKFASSRNPHKRLIISAAKDKDLRLLRDELINWGQRHFPKRNITNLQDIADIFNNQHFNKELDKIREALYAENEKDWNSKEFLDTFCKLSKQIKKHQRTAHEPLPKLYK